MSGKMDQAKGKVKEAAGDLTGNQQLKKSGKADQNAGKAKEAVGGVANKMTDAIDSTKRKANNTK